MKRRIISMMFAALLLVLTACASQHENAEQTPSDEQPAPLRDDLNVYSNTPFVSLSPLTGQGTVAGIYETLAFELFTDRGLYKEHALCENIDVSDDGINYTFHLKKDVPFHSGGTMTSEDVLFSFETHQTNAIMAAFMSNILSFEAPDEYTFSITLKSPDPAFFSSSLKNLYIFSKSFYDENGAEGFENQTAGTGPYTVKSFADETRLVLQSFDSYHGGEKAIKTITQKYLPDAFTAQVAFESGELDTLIVQPSGFDELAATGKYEMLEIEGAKYNLTFLNSAHPVLSDLRVRQAINYALDRDTIAVIAGEGHALPAYTHVPQVSCIGAPSRQDLTESFTYDPEKARALLLEAGYTEPVSIGTIMTATQTESKIAQVMQSQLAEVGLLVEMEPVDAANKYERIVGRDYSLSIFELMPFDEYSGLNIFYLTNSALNATGTEDVRFDELFAQARASLDAQERADIYKQIANLEHEHAMYAHTIFTSALVAKAKGLDVPCSMYGVPLLWLAEWK